MRGHNLNAVVASLTVMELHFMYCLGMVLYCSETCRIRRIYLQVCGRSWNLTIFSKNNIAGVEIRFGVWREKSSLKGTPCY